MKKIILENYEIKVNNKIVKSSDKELLKTPLSNFSIGGKQPVTFEKLKQLDTLSNKIDSATTELLLENADYIFLKETFMEYGNWNPADHIRPYIIKTGEKLNNAEEVKIEAVKKEKVTK